MPDAQESELERCLRRHGRFEVPPVASVGSIIGGWKVLAFLGRGGSAEVYRAESAATGIVGALKVLYRADDKALGRFRREARLAAELSGSAFPKFYGAGEDSGRLYLAEELLEPTELPHGDAAVARYVLGVSCAVEELHKRGFIHRDIKPRNVMVRPSTGECVLIDLGLAKEDDTLRSQNDTLSVVDGRAVGVGTPGFSAPEQFAGGKIGPATDIHALGMLANVCFGGKPPKAWARIVRRSTSSIPEQRYATVAEFARAVRRRHAERWWIGGIAAVLLIGAAAICVTLMRKDAEQQSAAVSQPVQPQAGSARQQVANVHAGADGLGELLLDAVYETYYGGDTNIDKKAALELMRQGLPPSY